MSGNPYQSGVVTDPCGVVAFLMCQIRSGSSPMARSPFSSKSLSET